tara:strand:- start:674 stop:1675 length:1002 start_codon:yes stop_codon:yes gene_type:complete
MENVILPTFEEMENLKQLSLEERMEDINSLKKFDGLTSGIKYAGNKYIQHYFFREISKVRFENKPSLYEIMQDEELKKKLYKGTFTKDKNLAVNMAGAYTRMSPVCIFKPSIAKFLYTKFKPTAVLDFTAGWGGRMLGAISYGCKYTGIDTNISLKPNYELMMKELGGDATMIWKSALDVEFSSIDYDMVLTSPPYINKELYEHMKPFESSKSYYVDFLIPLINKSLANIKNNGFVCININKEYYEGLLKQGFRKADEIVEYQQSTRQDKEGKTKMEMVYCWRNDLNIQTVLDKKEIKESTIECKNNSCNNCLKLEEENRILRKKIEQLKLLI